VPVRYSVRGRFTHFKPEGAAIDPAIVMEHALALFGDARPHFKASRKWLRGFLKRHRLSLRVGNPQKPSEQMPKDKLKVVGCSFNLSTASTLGSDNAVLGAKQRPSRRPWHSQREHLQL
jgi:hypothetical protein